MSARAALAALAAALVLAGCGGKSNDGKSNTSAPAAAEPSTAPARVETVATLGGGNFDPSEIYRREAPGVVTVISEFTGGTSILGQGGARGQGSGFVISASGEIATNAHVVSDGEGSSIRRAQAVYVQFADGNEVTAKIIGIDPDSDVGLLRIDPAGLTLRPLPLGSSAKLVVGAPVVAIGSPFGEPQSLSVGVISGLHRTIPALTSFQISDAIQTDAAINHGNSGGPLLDARGRVLGINAQIAPGSSGGEGVGFAVPVDTVKRSLDQLRANGRVSYAFLGISSAPVYPQLAKNFKLGVDHGAWVQSVVAGSPAAKAGIRPGSRTERFQAQPYRVGGDVIAAVNGRAVREDADLSRYVSALKPGETITLEIYRGGSKRSVRVKLAARPSGVRLRDRG